MVKNHPPHVTLKSPRLTCFPCAHFYRRMDISSFNTLFLSMVLQSQHCTYSTSYQRTSFSTFMCLSLALVFKHAQTCLTTPDHHDSTLYTWSHAMFVFSKKMSHNVAVMTLFFIHKLVTKFARAFRPQRCGSSHECVVSGSHLFGVCLGAACSVREDQILQRVDFRKWFPCAAWLDSGHMFDVWTLLKAFHALAT